MCRNWRLQYVGTVRPAKVVVCGCRQVPCKRMMVCLLLRCCRWLLFYRRKPGSNVVSCLMTLYDCTILVRQLSVLYVLFYEKIDCRNFLSRNNGRQTSGSRSQLKTAQTLPRLNCELFVQVDRQVCRECTQSPSRSSVLVMMSEFSTSSIRLKRFRSIFVRLLLGWKSSSLVAPPEVGEKEDHSTIVSASRYLSATSQYQGTYSGV